MCVYGILGIPADPCLLPILMFESFLQVGIRWSRHWVRSAFQVPAVGGRAHWYMAPLVACICIYLVFIKCEEHTSSPLNEMGKINKLKYLHELLQWYDDIRITSITNLIFQELMHDHIYVLWTHHKSGINKAGLYFQPRVLLKTHKSKNEKPAQWL